MEKRVFALGFFDGVHLGHQALLAACVELAKKMDGETAAITFERHPQSLYSDQTPPLLGALQDRSRLLMQYGMEHIYAFPVTKEVMSTPWRAFLDELVECGGAGFVCGDDFRFGAGGLGNAEKLADFCRKRGIPYAVVPQQEVDGVRVSSTYIRQLLENGEMEQVNRFLGHPHILSGQVVAGRGLGHTIGIPTANILIPEGVAVPRLGVYAGSTVVEGKEYLTVTNIGSRPTVGGHQVRAESWLLDFEGDLYGKSITLAFWKFLRPERKFDSLEELKAQILLDAEQVKKLTMDN